MGFFDFGPSSTSSASDSRQGAGDAAKQLRASGGKNTIVSEGAHFADLAGAKINTAPTVSGNKGNVTINDLGAVSDLASHFTDAIQNITAQSSGALSSALSAQSGQVSDALGKVADLSSNAQTGGSGKIILYVVLGVLGLVGAIFYFKR